MIYPKKIMKIKTLMGLKKLKLHRTIAEEILPEIITATPIYIPFGTPGYPFFDILDPDNFRIYMKKQINFKKKNLTLSSSTESVKFSKSHKYKNIPPHFTLITRPPSIIPVFFLDSTNSKKMELILANCENLFKLSFPTIICTENEEVREKLVDFMNKRNISEYLFILTKRDFILLMKINVFESLTYFMQTRKELPLRALVENLRKSFKRWPVKTTETEILKIMKRMGLKFKKEPTINLEHSVFGRGGSWEKVGNKKNMDIRSGIVGMGERGINVLRTQLDIALENQRNNRNRPMEVVAVCDVNPEAIDKAFNQLKINELPSEFQPRRYNTLEEFLADSQIDIVYITVPATIDQYVGKMVVEAGKAPMVIVKEGDPRGGSGPMKL